jgi:hypothetical protein
MFFSYRPFKRNLHSKYLIILRKESTHRCTRVENPRGGGGVLEVFAKISRGVKGFRKNCLGVSTYFGFYFYCIFINKFFKNLLGGWGGCFIPQGPSHLIGLRSTRDSEVCGSPKVRFGLLLAHKSTKCHKLIKQSGPTLLNGITDNVIICLMLSDLSDLQRQEEITFREV